MNESAAAPCDRLSRRLAIACRALAWASLLLCAPPARDAMGAVVLAGPLVLAPAGYLLVLVVATVSIGLALASWMIARARRAASDDGSAAPARLVRDRVVRWLVNGTAALALSISILVAGFECLLAAPYIADPASSAGDRVVVVERNVLLAGYGDVYLVPGGFGVGRKVASYSADDGYSPMGNGTYALEWRGSEPHFTAYGTPANPVMMDPAD